jgi:hypothetical protein
MPRRAARYVLHTAGRIQTVLGFLDSVPAAH